MARSARPLVAAVLYQDDWLLVVDKPAGALSVPGRASEPTVADLLRSNEQVGPNEPFLTVHRLDRDASGVLVFARTSTAQRAMTELFTGRAILKRYLALATGRVAIGGTIDLALAANSDNTRAAVDVRRGKPSVTIYRPSEYIAGHTLVECEPHTGRLHQIRVHLATIGHPIACDPLYGDGMPILLSRFKRGFRTSGRHTEIPLLDRLALHAAGIEFDHPHGGRHVAFEAPWPRDLRATLTQLRKAAARHAESAPHN